MERFFPEIRYSLVRAYRNPFTPKQTRDTGRKLTSRKSAKTNEQFELIAFPRSILERYAVTTIEKEDPLFYFHFYFVALCTYACNCRNKL